MSNIVMFFLLIIDLVLTAAKGYVLSELWGWFIFPLGVVNIGVLHAIGITFIAHILSPIPTEKDPDIPHMVALKAVRIVLAYISGAVIHSLMV